LLDFSPPRLFSSFRLFPVFCLSWVSIYHNGPVSFCVVARSMWPCVWRHYVPRKCGHWMCVLLNTRISDRWPGLFSIAALSVTDVTK
jgi:hypothetical protein